MPVDFILSIKKILTHTIVPDNSYITLRNVKNMKFSNDLYLLIHSLSPSEKRYVKIVIKAFSAKGTTTQLALFDAFEQQKQFNEQKIRTKLIAQIPPKTFHLSKNRLYKLIIKALYLYHSKGSESEVIRQNLFKSTILSEKGLVKQAKKINNKALQTASKIENYALTLQSLENQCPKATSLDPEEMLAKKLEALTYYKNDIIYHYLQQKLLSFIKKFSHLENKEEHHLFKELKEHPYIKNNNILKSSKAEQIHQFIHNYIRSHEKDN